MKLSKLFFGFAAAAMFAACTSDDLVADQQTTQPEGKGTGYVAFTISNAEAKATRGVNDNFANGETEEYAVKNVTLVICSADGSVQEAYDMTDTDFGKPAPDGSNVTEDKLYVQKITYTGDPYAFVIINHNGFFQLDGTTLKDKVGNTITNVNNLATTEVTTNTNAEEFTTNGILMMNAPLADKKGMTGDPSGASISPLVNKLHVYDTEADATTHLQGVGEVYVERAVAKVDLSGSYDSTGSDPIAWEITGWTLDNTNKKSYLLHNVSNLTSTVLAYKATGVKDIYRMVGSKDVQHDDPASAGTGTANSRYRTYFGQDPNMGLAPAQADAAMNRVLAVGSKPKFQYCAENLFDVQHMDYANTTRALVKVKLTVPAGKVAYARPGDDHFYDEAAIASLANEKAVKKAQALSVWAYVKYNIGKDKLEFDTTVNTDGTVDVVLKNINIDAITDAEATAAGYTDKADAIAKFTDDVLKQSVSASEFGFSFYDGGVAYYDVRIQHFGQDYTPWNKTAADIDDTAKAYETTYDADKYLGRWGVLRNNWYSLNVTSISKIGYANPADIDLDSTTAGGYDPTTPDDNTPADEKWVAVDVNVLSWAQRLQTVKF